jgi:hypothetical protein
MKALKDLVTESDGVSYCPARLLWITGAIAFIMLSFYAAIHGKDFNSQDFGLGYGGLLAGGGSSVLLKGKVE